MAAWPERTPRDSCRRCEPVIRARSGGFYVHISYIRGRMPSINLALYSVISKVVPYAESTQPFGFSLTRSCAHSLPQLLKISRLVHFQALPRSSSSLSMSR